MARSTGVDRFMGGVAAAVDAGGAVAVLYRRVFPGHDSASQVTPVLPHCVAARWLT